MIEKMAARNFARNYLQDLVPGVFSSLEDSGYFYDVVEREVETDFMPWLMKDIVSAHSKAQQARALLDHIIMETITQHSMTTKTYYDQKAAEEAERSKAEAAQTPVDAPEEETAEQ